MVHTVGVMPTAITQEEKDHSLEVAHTQTRTLGSLGPAIRIKDHMVVGTDMEDTHMEVAMATVEAMVCHWPGVYLAEHYSVDCYSERNFSRRTLKAQ
jgi:hypothetical protein